VSRTCRCLASLPRSRTSLRLPAGARVITCKHAELARAGVLHDQSTAFTPRPQACFSAVSPRTLIGRARPPARVSQARVLQSRLSNGTSFDRAHLTLLIDLAGSNNWRCRGDLPLVFGRNVDRLWLSMWLKVPNIANPADSRWREIASRSPRRIGIRHSADARSPRDRRFRRQALSTSPYPVPSGP